MTSTAATLPGRGLPLRTLAWLVGPALVAATHWLLLDASPLARMFALCTVLLLWMKVVVAAGVDTRLSAPRWLAWGLLWPGMQPRRFEAGRAAARPRVLAPLLCVLAGAALLVGARELVIPPWAASIAALTGLSLLLHFGFFGLLACAWQVAGVDVRPLFRNPLASRSLGEFWSRRWNIAFSEMLQLSITAPLAARPRLAFAAVFAASALLHEVAISLPVRAGWGLPSLYFVLQGLGVALERRLFPRGSRLWAVVWVIAPLPLCFHPWFVHGVVWPLVGIGEA